MQDTFTAIDFETAHSKRWSICQVGLVRNIEIHGITPERTRTAPNFSAIWAEIRPFIQQQTVVAHNGAFDFSCLSQTLDYFGIAQPIYDKQCTYKIYKKKLASLCLEHQIALNHHDALSDALACAELYKIHLKRLKDV